MKQILAFFLLVSLGAGLVACGGSAGDAPKSDAPPRQENPYSDEQMKYFGLTKHEVQRLYVTCQVCHGEDGKKAYGGAKDLTESTLSMDERVAIIKYGKGKMTPYEGRLTDNEIRALARYIEVFRGPSQP